MKALPPLGDDPYWRLDYYLHGRRKQARGGRTRASAEAKMARVLARLDADLDDDLGQQLGEKIIDKWMLPGQLQTRGKAWADGTRIGHTWYVGTYLKPVLGGLRAEEWGKSAYRAIMKSAPTAAEAKQIRRRLSALLHWSLRAGYLTPEQVVALQQVSFVKEAHHIERPQRTQALAKPGKRSVTPAAVAMSVDDLTMVGDELQKVYKHGKLLVEFAAATGLRQGELFAVPVDNIELASRRVHVLEQWNAKAYKLTDPKGTKPRVAMFVAGPTITGYDLEGALAARCAEALAEEAAGRNRGARLFPAPRGGFWSSSNFDSRAWVPAMDAGKVPYVEWEEIVRTGERKGQMTTRRAYLFTTHSLRDRFAISALNLWGFDLSDLQLVGGWEDSKVIFERYYGVARDALDRLQAKTAKGDRG